MTERLADAEREKLVRLSNGLVGEDKISAICAYGSKVAGYARPDSDYDLIIVAKRLREEVRYKYLNEPIQASALIVDERMLLDDAKNASLGEFVAGRFLNVYEPIINRDYLHEVEVDYKKRVIGESLIELASNYSDFSQDLIVPLDFFLFDKLKKRALVYPPALYSYVRTYSCDNGAENRNISVEGFAEAAKSLEPSGVLKLDGDSVTILPAALKANALAKLNSIITLTTRSVTQYAVHGYAGRVGFNVLRSEALSKLKRMGEGYEPPEELDNPVSLLRLGEGKILQGGERLVEELAGVAGLGTNFEMNEKPAGELYSTARIVELRNGSKSLTFVVKHYSDIKSVKWALLNLWTLTAKMFSMTPMSRMHREYSALRKFREVGVKTPRVVGAALDDRILVTEFVPGTQLSINLEMIMQDKDDDLTWVKEYAGALSRIHRSGYVVGDTKANNVLIFKGEMYLTDLEQAVEGGDKAWDIAEFLYYTAKFSTKGEGMRTISDAFLETYRAECGPETISKAMSVKYLAPFRPILTPKMATMIRDGMAKYSS